MLAEALFGADVDGDAERGRPEDEFEDEEDFARLHVGDVWGVCKEEWVLGLVRENGRRKDSRRAVTGYMYTTIWLRGERASAGLDPCVTCRRGGSCSFEHVCSTLVQHSISQR